MMLLLLGTFIMTTAAINEKDVLDEFNKLRQKMATDSQTPNVMELTWDSNLVSQISQLPADCNSLTNGPDYRVFLTKPDANAQIFENIKKEQLEQMNGQVPNDKKKEMSNQIAKTLEERAKDPSFNIGELEVLVPYQTKVGCADHKCTAVVDEKDGLEEHVGKPYSYDVVCLLGPKNYLEDGNEKGPAGSQCSAGTTNKNGLCSMAPGPIASMPAPGPSPDNARALVLAPGAPVEQKDNSSAVLNFISLLVITFITLFIDHWS